MLVSSKDKTKTTKELIDASIGALIDALEAGHSEALTAYLSAMANFHYYSFGNILLMAAQKPGATRVAGIWAWNKLGRRVRRGEKGIMILAPMVGKKRRKSVEAEQAENESQTSDAKSKREGKQPSSDRRLGFWAEPPHFGREGPEKSCVFSSSSASRARPRHPLPRTSSRFRSPHFP